MLAVELFINFICGSLRFYVLLRCSRTFYRRLRSFIHVFGVKVSIHLITLYQLTTSSIDYGYACLSAWGNGCLMIWINIGICWLLFVETKKYFCKSKNASPFQYYYIGWILGWFWCIPKYIVCQESFCDILHRIIYFYQI